MPLQLQKPQIHVATLGLQKTAVNPWGALSKAWKRRGTPVMNSVRNHASKLRRPPRSAWPRELGASSGNRGRLAGAGLGAATAFGAQYAVPGADTVPGPTDTTPTGPTDTAVPGPTDTPAQPGMFDSLQQSGSDMYDAAAAKGSELADGAVSQFRQHQKDPSAYWSGIGQQAAGLGSSAMQHVKDNAGAYGVGAAGLALLHWLHSRNQKEEEPQFKAAAVTRQLDLAATQHPFVVGFLTKLAADGRTGEQVERAMNTAAATPIVGDEVVGFLKTAGAWDTVKGVGSAAANTDSGSNALRAATGIAGSLGGGLAAAGGAAGTAYNWLADKTHQTANSANAAMGGSPKFWPQPAKIPQAYSSELMANGAEMARSGVKDVGQSVGVGGLDNTSKQYRGPDANNTTHVAKTLDTVADQYDASDSTRQTMHTARNAAGTAMGGAAAAMAAPAAASAVRGTAAAVPAAVAGAGQAIGTAAASHPVIAGTTGLVASNILIDQQSKAMNQPRDLQADSLFGEDGQLTTQFTSPEAKEQGLLGAYDELSQAYSTPGDPAHNDAAALTASGRRLYGEMSPETAAARPELRQRFGPHPAERDQYMATGLQQDMEVVQNEQADPAQRQDAATRATENAVSKSAENMGMDMQSAIAEGDKPMDQANPDAVEAFGANPDVQAKVQQDVESGAFPDFMSGLKSFWDGMDGTQTMALLGGLALGAVGIMSSLFGDGGMGGALLGALGLGIAGVGSGALDQLMGQFGGSTEPTAQTPDPQASQPPPAVPGAAGGPAGPPQPAGVPAQPANVNTLPPIPSALESAGTGGTQQSQPTGDVTQASASQPANRFANTPLAGVFADGQLSGEEVQQTMNNPAAVNHILDDMPDADAGKLIAQAAKADPQFMQQIRDMQEHPDIARTVLTTPKGQMWEPNFLQRGFGATAKPGVGLSATHAAEMIRHSRGVPAG